ncbi:MAG: hypothetical protein WCY71_12340 [Halothiobacillaceae bacterium]
MAKKKFSPRQMAQIKDRRFDREMRRITGERYLETDGHIVRRDMEEEIASWY